MLGLVENVGHKRLLSLRWRFILNSFFKLKALLFSLESPFLENMKVHKTEIQVGAGCVELNGLERFYVSGSLYLIAACLSELGRKMSIVPAPHR